MSELKLVPSHQPTVRLFPYTPEVASNVLAWAEKPKNAEFFRRTPPICDWMSQDRVDAMFKGLWVVAEDDAVVGLVSLTGHDPISRSIDFGILVDGAKDGRRVSSLALNQVADYVFNYMNLHKIYVKILPWRDRLARRLETHGFTKECDLRDSCYFKGEYHSEMLYSCLKLEFKEVL